MAEFFSQSAQKRLPVAIQKLSEKHQAAFILLRMRRNESFIAREIKSSLDDAGIIIREVQEELVKSGALDLIQDPVFFQIDHPRENESGPGRQFELPGEEMDIGDQVELERFYRILAESVEQLPKESRRLLSLWFNKEMKAKDILGFYRKLGLPLNDKKPIAETTEQDVFYALEKNIKKLLETVRSNMKHEDDGLTPSALKAILNETGV